MSAPGLGQAKTKRLCHVSAYVATVTSRMAAAAEVAKALRLLRRPVEQMRAGPVADPPSCAHKTTASTRAAAEVRKATKEAQERQKWRPGRERDRERSGGLGEEHPSPARVRAVRNAGMQRHV